MYRVIILSSINKIDSNFIYANNLMSYLYKGNQTNQNQKDIAMTHLSNN